MTSVGQKVPSVREYILTPGENRARTVVGRAAELALGGVAVGILGGVFGSYHLYQKYIARRPA